jgi:hypothetical protein
MMCCELSETVLCQAGNLCFQFGKGGKDTLIFLDMDMVVVCAGDKDATNTSEFKGVEISILPALD